MSSLIQSHLNVCHHCFSIMPHSPMPISYLFLHRVPQTGVNSDWPSSVHFTFQLYRFQPVTTERLKLLEPERNSKLKSNPHYPCVLSLINKDGSPSSGMVTILLRMFYDSAQHFLFHLLSFVLKESLLIIWKQRHIYCTHQNCKNNLFALMNLINACKHL